MLESWRALQLPLLKATPWREPGGTHRPLWASIFFAKVICDLERSLAIFAEGVLEV
jgi:hypothetical protein